MEYRATWLSLWSFFAAHKWYNYRKPRGTFWLKSCFYVQFLHSPKNPFHWQNCVGYSSAGTFKFLRECKGFVNECTFFGSTKALSIYFFSVTMIFSAGVSNPRRADINVGLHIFMLPFQFFPFYGTFIWRMCFYNHFKFYSFILPSNLIKKRPMAKFSTRILYCVICKHKQSSLRGRWFQTL